MIPIGTDGACSRSEAGVIRLAKVCLEICPSLVAIIEPIPFEDGQLIEASSLDGNVSLVDHLLHRIWWQENACNDVAFIEAMLGFHPALHLLSFISFSTGLVTQ